MTNKNNFIFIIVVIVIIIIIVAISNRSEEITHHHTKPHFDQPKNVMRITASDHIRTYNVFKVVMNDHSEETDQVFKGHEVDNSTTSLVQIGTIDNTVPHGTTIEIPLDGEPNDQDPASTLVQGVKIDGGIETTPPVTATQSTVRSHTVKFPAGNYGLPPPFPGQDPSIPAPPLPIISDINHFYITINKGSTVSIANVNVMLGDSGKIDEENIFFLGCGLINPPFTCSDPTDYASYGPLPSGLVVNNPSVYCFTEDGVPCISDVLSKNTSFALKFIGSTNNDFILINDITFDLIIDESSINNNAPCGTKTCSFLQ